MRKRKSIIIYIIVGILFSMIFLNQISFARVKGKVNNSNIRVRKEPNTTSGVVTTLYLTDKVFVLGKTGEWYKIETEEKQIGYMKAEFIDTDVEKVNQLAPLDSTTTNTTENNNTTTTTEKVEEKPTTVENTTPQNTNTNVNNSVNKVKIKNDTSLKSFPVIYSLDKVEVKKGEELEKVEVRNNWVKVIKDNKEYWVNNSNIE